MDTDNTDNVIEVDFGGRQPVRRSAGPASKRRFGLDEESATGSRRKQLPSHPILEHVTDVLKRNTDERRYERGVGYTLDSAVTVLKIDDGVVSGAVQGTQPRPFLVSVNLPSREQNKLDAVYDWLAEDNLASKPGIDAFIMFFCQKYEAHDLSFECTCPDSVECCKHVVAVLLAMALRVFDDPTVMYQLRGMTGPAVERRTLRREETSGAQFNDRKVADALPPLPEVAPIDNPLRFNTFPDERFSYRSSNNQIQDVREVGLRHAVSPVCVGPAGVLKCLRSIEDLWDVLVGTLAYDSASQTDSSDVDTEQTEDTVVSHLLRGGFGIDGGELTRS